MLGARLVDRGLITERQLEMAMREQKRTGVMLGEILTMLGFVTSQMLSSALAEQGGVQFVELADRIITPDALSVVPETLARRLDVIPLDIQGQELTLAMANIYDIEAITEIETLTRLRVKVVGAPEEEIHTKINEAYGERKSIEELIEEAIQAAVGERGSAETELPIVRVVDQLLMKALRDRESRIWLLRWRSTPCDSSRSGKSSSCVPLLKRAKNSGFCQVICWRRSIRICVRCWMQQKSRRAMKRWPRRTAIW